MTRKKADPPGTSFVISLEDQDKRDHGRWYCLNPDGSACSSGHWRIHPTEHELLSGYLSHVLKKHEPEKWEELMLLRPAFMEYVRPYCTAQRTGQFRTALRRWGVNPRKAASIWKDDNDAS